MAANPAACASATVSQARRASGLTEPTAQVRVMSDRYPCSEPPVSTSTKSPSSKTRSSEVPCGNAALGPNRHRTQTSCSPAAAWASRMSCASSLWRTPGLAPPTGHGQRGLGRLVGASQSRELGGRLSQSHRFEQPGIELGRVPHPLDHAGEDRSSRIGVDAHLGLGRQGGKRTGVLGPSDNLGVFAQLLPGSTFLERRADPPQRALGRDHQHKRTLATTPTNPR